MRLNGSIIGVTYVPPTSSAVGIFGNFDVFTQQRTGVLPLIPITFPAEFLVIAGGGGGGMGLSSRGGGGAGGYRSSVGTENTGGGFPTESRYNIVLNTPYNIQVGGGGAGSAANNTPGGNGGDSIFGAVSAVGGGGGGGYTGSTPLYRGIKGGSGGGASTAADSVTYFGGMGLSGQGFYGGTGCHQPGISEGAGGGGGAGAPGGNRVGGQGGSGGAGVSSSIDGVAKFRSGGGGGGGNAGGAGGNGGGGAGSGGATHQDGFAQTGGGGGGGANGTPPTTPSKNGGSGIVFIRVPNQYTAQFSSGVTAALTGSVAGFNVYAVTATSTINETVTFVYKP